METVFKPRVGLSTTFDSPPIDGGFAINYALLMWGGWTLDVPPTGTTGDHDLDLRLADAFRALLALPDASARHEWLERAVFSTDDFVPAPRHADFPPAAAQPSRYREILIRWWLDIFNETGR